MRRVLATFLVNTTADLATDDCSDGSCSLRAALVAAAASPEADRIEIPAGNYVIDPENGPLRYESESDLVIAGLGTSMTEVMLDGNSESQVLVLRNTVGSQLVPMVAVENLTIQNGLVPDSTASGETQPSSIGDGIDAVNVELRVSSVLFQDNGGDFVNATVRISSEEGSSSTIEDSVFTNNTQSSVISVIQNPGNQFTILRTQIENNSTTAAIVADITDVTIRDSSISDSGNTVIGNSAGTDVDPDAKPSVTIENSTFIEDSDLSGSGIDDQLVLTAVDLLMENVTISGGEGFASGINFLNNAAGVSNSGLIRHSTITNSLDRTTLIGDGGDISIESSIVNGECGFDENPTSLGNNIGPTSCGLVASSDLGDVDPLLGPLADNGGLVSTHALLTGSPAIDAAGNTPTLTDARGVTRPQDGNGDSILASDIGAFEAEEVVGPTLSIADITVNESAGTATIEVTLNADVAGGFTVDAFTMDDGPYTRDQATLTFAGNAGEIQTFTIPIFDDALSNRTKS